MPTSAADDVRSRRPHLVVRNLTAGYGGAPVVNDVSLEVGEGEIVALLGPNGAGKSTVLKALVGVAEVSAGTAMLGEVDITRLRPHRLATHGCGYVPQSRDVFDDLTVKENLEVGGYLLDRGTIAERIEGIGETFPRLTEMMGRTARKLSGGERKMLAIARVLMAKPTLMLLDEPTANLSPALADRLLGEQIAAVAATGAAVLLVEQKAAAALSAADWAYLLVAGQIVRSGDPAKLRSQPDFAQAFLGGAPDEPATGVSVWP